MPYLYMPVDNNAEGVKQFFDAQVQAGKMRIIDATQGVDTLDELHPCDDLRVIVGTEPTCPLADVDIAKTLDKFVPEPDAETQFNSWNVILESDSSGAKEGAKVDAPAPESNADAAAETAAASEGDMGMGVSLGSEENSPAAAEGAPVTEDQAALDQALVLKPRTSYSSRGYKG